MDQRTILALVGDSDIDRWPQSLLPRLPVGACEYAKSGHSGATLKDILPHIHDAVSTAKSRNLIMIVCAGENDIGKGVTLSATESHFTTMLGIVFNEATDQQANCSLVFLGPKIEPWLKDDTKARQEYIHMSNCMKDMCTNYKHASRIAFIDCLTMFCGSSGEHPGALFGGRAQAEPQYFDADQLHLSDKGYIIWKLQIEDAIKELLNAR